MKNVIGILCAWIAMSGLASDVKTINNAMAPSGKGVTLNLVEDLVIGPEADQDMTIWPDFTSSVDADSKGHMYVCDTGGSRIVEFDSKGNFVRTIGQKGNGPGEFQALKSFQVLQDGRGIAFENMQVVSTISYFDKELNFQDKKTHQSMENMITSALFSPDGQWSYATVASLNIRERKLLNKFAILDAELKLKKEIMGFESALPDPAQFGNSDYWANFLGESMKKASRGLVGFAAFDQNGNIFSANAGHYEITKWNSKMEPQLKFNRKYKPVPMTEDEIKSIVEPIHETVASQMPPQLQGVITQNTIQKAIKLAEFPAVKNPVAGLKTTPNGFVLVIHDASMSTKSALVDIFSTEGQFLGSFRHDTVGITRMVFKNGFAYTLEIRDDENHLVRYRVKII